MKTTYFLFVTFMVTVAFASIPCYSQIKYKINLSDNFNKNEKIELSSIAKSIEYVPLETTPDCILDSDYKVDLTNEYIFILDYINLYRFSRSGKFLNKIGRRGKGPGEYVRIGATFVINDNNNEVFLLDCGGDKILVYTYEGKFKRNIKLQYHSYYMSSILNKYLIHHNVYYNRFSKNTPTYEFEVLNFEGKKINQLESTADRSKKYGLSPLFPQFYHYNNLTQYKHPLNDTIFSFREPNKKIPYAILSPKKHKRDVEQRDYDFKSGKINDEKSILVSLIQENSHHMFIELTKGYELYRLLYNKETEKCINSFTGLPNYIDKKREATYTKGIVNDIDGGFPFWPSHIQGSMMIDFRYAYEFQFLDNEWFNGKVIRNEQLNANLRRISKTINESDNPVLVIVK